MLIMKDLNIVGNKVREFSLELLHEWVSSDSLRKHCYAVAAAMEEYAMKNKLPREEIDKWWICGLLHDFDYEKFPSMEKHPFEGVKILREKNYDEKIVNAIIGHGNHTGVKRESDMAKTLFAVDELCGLIMALAKVRPGNFDGMNANSVKKAMKKKDFAAAINREDIKQGIQELGVNEDEHFEIVIRALKICKKDLGFC